MAGVTLAKAGGQLGHRIRKIHTAANRGNRSTLNAAGIAGKREHLKVITRDTGGDGRLSRVGASKGRRPNPKVGASYRLRGDAVEFKATGPMQIIANPAEPHGITSAYLRRGRVHRSNDVMTGNLKRLKFGPKSVISVPGADGPRRWARHPGHRGKDTWNRAVPAATKAASKAMRDQYANIVRSAFR